MDVVTWDVCGGHLNYNWKNNDLKVAPAWNFQSTMKIALLGIFRSHIFSVILQQLGARLIYLDPEVNWIAMSPYWAKWKVIASARLLYANHVITSLTVRQGAPFSGKNGLVHHPRKGGVTMLRVYSDELV